MARFEIKVKRFDELQKFPEHATEVFSDSMTVAMELIHGGTIERSPVDRGFFVSSLAPEVLTASPLQIIGRESAIAPHSPVIEGVDLQGNRVEFGRRPGAKFPPVNALRSWVERRLGVPSDQSAQVAYLVGRAIVKRGIKPSRPMQRAADAAKGAIEKLFNEAGERLARRIEGRR